MVAGETARGSFEGERNGIRLMLVRTHGCRICVALDAVEGIFEQHGAADGATFTLAHGATIPLVDWATVTGVPAERPADETQVMVLRSATGLVGLRIGACLGVRSVSLARTPPMPTRLTDAAGSPLCFLLMLDGRPHLMLEPRGLLTRIGAAGAANGEARDGLGVADERPA
ncbi:MAG: chemotaxis protein CheW [Thermodesulfobacteriota bacterium]